MRETQREIERETEREHCLYVSLEGSKSTTAVIEGQVKGVESRTDTNTVVCFQYSVVQECL